MTSQSIEGLFVVQVTISIVFRASLGVSTSDPSYGSHRYESSLDTYRPQTSGHDRGGGGGGGAHGYTAYRGHVGGGAGSSGGGDYGGRYVEEASQKGNDAIKDSKYYYGGQYKGGCQADGLYYQDDTSFVMCSNGYPHQQPCPPGTKTSGSPSYKPGYYYGYTDLCSVNLVDYGLSPEYYAPVGYPSPSASKDSHDGPSQRGGREKGDVYSKQLTASLEKQSNGYSGGGNHQGYGGGGGYQGSAYKAKSLHGGSDFGNHGQKDFSYNSAAYPLVADSVYPARGASFLSGGARGSVGSHGGHSGGHIPSSGHINHRSADNSIPGTHSVHTSSVNKPIAGGHVLRPIHATFTGSGSASHNTGLSSQNSAASSLAGRSPYSNVKGGGASGSTGGTLPHSGAQAIKYSAVYPAGGHVSGAQAIGGGGGHQSTGSDRTKYNQPTGYVENSNNLHQSGRAFHSI